MLGDSRDVMLLSPRGASLFILVSMLAADAMQPIAQSNRVGIRLGSTMTPKGRSRATDSSDDDKSSTSQSNFWFSETQNTPETEDSGQIPCVASLDSDGPLPLGAYRTFGDQRNEPVPTCLVSVAVNLDTANTISVNSQEVIRRMHSLIDSGLTTFQLKSGDECRYDWARANVYGKLRRETPESVLNQCHLVVPFSTPTSSALTSRSAVRSRVLASLSQIGTECIDTLQLKFVKQSPYHLDVLDILHELQRDGLIRSISSNGFTSHLLREAFECGFSIDSHQINGSLLYPAEYNSRELQLACKELDIPILMASPLAGGLLSERHVDVPFEPLPSELTPFERKAIKSVLPSLAQIHGNGSGQAWRTFQQRVMIPLSDISLKHRVSVSTVALRWTLQNPYVSGIVPSCTLIGADTDDRPYKRPAQLRQVFKLELDEDDMKRLCEAAGGIQPTQKELKHSEDELPDLSDTNLWL